MNYLILIILIFAVGLLFFILKRINEVEKEFSSLREDVNVQLKELYIFHKKYYANIFNAVAEKRDKDVEEKKVMSDGLYEAAKEIVLDAGKCSVSFLQRRLNIGYSLSVCIIDRLEEEGVIGPQEGSMSREVFVEKTTVPEEYEEQILDLFEEKERVTNNDIEELLGVSDATATRYLDKLEDKVLIVQKGKGRSTYYERLPV